MEIWPSLNAATKYPLSDIGSGGTYVYDLTCPPARAIATPPPNDSPGLFCLLLLLIRASYGHAFDNRNSYSPTTRLRARRKFVRRVIEKIMTCSWRWGIGSFGSFRAKSCWPPFPLEGIGNFQN